MSVTSNNNKTQTEEIEHSYNTDNDNSSLRSSSVDTIETQNSEACPFTEMPEANLAQEMIFEENIPSGVDMRFPVPQLKLIYSNSMHSIIGSNEENIHFTDDISVHSDAEVNKYLRRFKALSIIEHFMFCFHE